MNKYKIFVKLDDIVINSFPHIVNQMNEKHNIDYDIDNYSEKQLLNILKKKYRDDFNNMFNTEYYFNNILPKVWFGGLLDLLRYDNKITHNLVKRSKKYKSNYGNSGFNKYSLSLYDNIQLIVSANSSITPLGVEKIVKIIRRICPTSKLDYFILQQDKTIKNINMENGIFISNSVKELYKSNADKKILFRDSDKKILYKNKFNSISQFIDLLIDNKILILEKE